MAQILKNNVSGVLGLALGAAETSMTLLDASSFPTPSEGDFYLLTLIGLNANGQEASWEIVKVTGKASNTLTIVRAQEGTPATAWPVATTVQLRLTAASVVTPGVVASHVGATGTAHGVATTSVAGFMSAADKTKLDGVATGATAYTHPANHPASIITQDASNRFVTDAEKTAWNAKEAGGTASAAMTAHTGATDPHTQYLPKAGGTASGLTLSGGYTEGVFSVTGTTPALSPANGSIQTWTLTGNSTPTLGAWASGQSVTLMVDDGTAYSINWASMGVVWKTNGGTAPVLLTAGYTALVLVNVGGALYGWLAGNA